MEESRVCKICGRKFTNGKAMGGHMRSHLAKLPLPPKPLETSQKMQNRFSPPPPPYSATLQEEPQKHRLPAEKRVQEYRSVNHEICGKKPCLGGGVQDGEESETESFPKSLTGKRSKRRPKSDFMVYKSPVSASSATKSIFTEDDGAMCLYLLSRGKWDEEEEETDVGDGAGARVRVTAGEEDESFCCIEQEESKYRCEICDKKFRSPQALGGHRSSHRKMKFLADNRADEVAEDYAGVRAEISAEDTSGKKIKTQTPKNHDIPDEDSNGVDNFSSDKKMFDCPYCYRVFDSGRALGGHKKVHLSLARNSAKNEGDLLIDLNLPAPEDDGSDTAVE